MPGFFASFSYWCVGLHYYFFSFISYFDFVFQNISFLDNYFRLIIDFLIFRSLFRFLFVFSLSAYDFFFHWFSLFDVPCRLHFIIDWSKLFSLSFDYYFIFISLSRIFFHFHFIFFLCDYLLLHFSSFILIFIFDWLISCWGFLSMMMMPNISSADCLFWLIIFFVATLQIFSM